MNQEGEGRESWTEPLTSRALSVSRLRRPSKVAACNPLSLISPPRLPTLSTSKLLEKLRKDWASRLHCHIRGVNKERSLSLQSMVNGHVWMAVASRRSWVARSSCILAASTSCSMSTSHGPVLPTAGCCRRLRRRDPRA